MALQNAKSQDVRTQLGLGYWRAHKEVISRTVHVKLMGLHMHKVRVCWRGVVMQVPHKKMTTQPYN